MNRLKYKIISSKPYDLVDDLLKTLLMDRGVDDVNALINVDSTSVLDPYLYRNMKEAVELLDKHVKKQSEIRIIVDSDFDGVSSATLIYLYIKRHLGIECSYIMHEGKQHGIVMDEFDGNFDFDLLIVPDGGSSDYEQHQELKSKGIDILVLDHHNAPYYSNDAIVVNHNVKGAEYPNKNLAGVGVVYKFCQALDIFYKTKYANDFLDLVACGNIADSMDLRDLEARFLTLKGMELLEKDKNLAESNEKTLGNKFIRAIVEKKKDRDLKFINFTSIGWKIAPIINGTIRAGAMEEKLDMFRAFIEEEETRMYQPRRKKKTDPKPEPIEVTLQEDMVRVCTNIKAKQDREVKKMKDSVEERIEEKKLADGKIIVVNASEIIKDGSMTGLIANKIASQYMKPVLLLREKDDTTFGGSARNFNMSPLDDLRGVINKTCMKGMGHDNACGIIVDKDKVVNAKQHLEELLKDVVMEGTYSIDYKIPVGRLKSQDVLKVGRLKEYWGNTLPEPKFLITNVVVNTSDIELIGERRNILKFKKGEHTFIKFFASEDYLNKMTMRTKSGFGKSPNTVLLNLICTFEINDYEGKQYPQIIIQDFDVQKKEEILF